MIEPTPTIQTVLCIPGVWSDRADLVERLLTVGLGLAAAAILDLDGGGHLLFDFEPPDREVAEAFEETAGDTLTESWIEAVQRHASVIFLFADGGSHDSMATLARFTSRILRAGGLGVRVESSGAVCPNDVWHALARSPSDPFILLRAFVIIAIEEEGAFSSGMHNLGHPDARVRGAGGRESGRLLDAFLRHLVIDRPSLSDGDTFTFAADGSRFLLTLGDCDTCTAEDLMFNPLGVWTLDKVS